MTSRNTVVYRYHGISRDGIFRWHFLLPRFPSLYKSSAVAEMGDRLATIDMAEKWGGAALGDAGSPLGHHLTQCGLGRGLPLYQVAS